MTMIKLPDPIVVDGEAIETLEVNLFHDNKDLIRRGGYSDRQTHVTIDAVPPSPAVKTIRLSSGDAYCSISENFRREEGRKFAIKRALDLQSDGGNWPDDIDLSEEDRRVIWHTFNPRFAKPKVKGKKYVKIELAMQFVKLLNECDLSEEHSAKFKKLVALLPKTKQVKTNKQKAKRKTEELVD